MSEQSQRKVKSAINWLIASAKYKRVYSKELDKAFFFKVNFITLTLPDTNVPVSDAFLKKKLLNPWLVYARKYFYLSNYVWKVERHKSGKLHIHITSDTFIHHKRLRWSWNRLLKRNGLIDEFAKEHGHYDPNSTDVHSVHKVKNLGAYLAKYMAKSESDEGIISGRQWGCSYQLSQQSKCCIEIMPDELSDEMRWLDCAEIDYKPIEVEKGTFKDRVRIGEVYFIKKGQWETLAKGMIKDAYRKHLIKIRSNLPSDVPEGYYVL